HQTPHTELYTLSLHDALPICTPTQKNTTNASAPVPTNRVQYHPKVIPTAGLTPMATPTLFVAPSATLSAKPQVKWSKRPSFFETDRKSTRLNSSHVAISYAVF